MIWAIDSNPSEEDKQSSDHYNDSNNENTEHEALVDSDVESSGVPRGASTVHITIIFIKV